METVGVEAIGIASTDTFLRTITLKANEIRLWPAPAENYEA